MVNQTEKKNTITNRKPTLTNWEHDTLFIKILYLIHVYLYVQNALGLIAFYKGNGLRENRNAFESHLHVFCYLHPSCYDYYSPIHTCRKFEY